MSPVTIPVSIVPPAVAFGRYIQAKVIAENSDRSSAIEFAKHWRNTPEVAACLSEEFFSTKSASNPGTIAEPAWAAPIAPLDQFGIAREPQRIIRGTSVFGAIRNRMRRVPFRVSVPREVGAGVSGAWVGEAAPTPVTQAQLDSLSQQIYKWQNIVVISQELAMLGTPDAQQTITQIVTGGVVASLDAQFLTASVTAIAGVRPAAITNGATEVTSTGGTAGQIIADLASLVGAITTAGESLVWVMRPTTAFIVAARLAGVGFATNLPNSLLGIPVVLSKNSPQQITLIDAAEIVYSDDDGLVVDVSRQASVELDSLPTSPVTSGTIMLNLWNANLVGIKTTQWIAYQRARDGALAYMTTSY